MLGDSEACRGAEVGSARDRPCGEPGPDALGELSRAGLVRPGQHQQELFPAPASGKVRSAQRFAKNVRERAQHFVADSMTVRVVHVLEPVEVSQND